ncbi:MAG: hypothetical protein COA47_05215 [Robiginitomaculum sp.]|nr:MAG: hypothetical protein COA47_05215 [Robiginitomaculum sp.]
MKTAFKQNILNSVSAVIIVAAVNNTPASAQSVLDEIVVTAQKRSENIQDVGISITALTGDQMKELGYTGVREINQQTPNLMIADLGGTPTITLVTIRGVSQNDFIDHQESPNAIFQDGAYNSFIGGVGSQMFDLERIEVLRGPQGTLFGRNSTGGLIHLISKRPTEELEGYGELTYGSYNQVRGEGAISGPLTDGLFGRLAVVYNRHDGFVKNFSGPDQSNANSLNVRARLLFEPSDTTEILFTGTYGRDFKVQGPGYIGVPGVNDLLFDANALPLGRTPVNQAEYDQYCTLFLGEVVAEGQQNCFGAPATGDSFSGNFNPSFFKRESYGALLEINHDFENVTFTSISDYKHISKSYDEDSDTSAVVHGDFTSDQKSYQFSQELRLSGERDRLNWQVGSYFLKINGDFITGFDSSTIPSAPFSFGANNQNPFKLNTISYAFFGQVDYAISDKVKLIGGIRWTRDQKDFEFHANCFEEVTGGCVANGFLLPGSVQETGFTKENAGDLTSLDQSAVSFKAQVEYTPDDDTLIYAGVTRANKAGSFNASIAANFSIADVPFSQEILTNYEAGIKLTTFEGKARINAAGFYYDYNDYQAAVFTPDLTNLVFNVDARVYGGEIEFVVEPFEGTTFVLGASYLDTLAKDVPIFGQKFDQELPLSPKWTVNAMLRQEWPTEYGRFFIQGDANFVDKRFSNTINSPANLLDSYILTNMRIGWSDDDDKITAEFFVNNITNNPATQLAFDLTLFFGNIQKINSAPRWFGGRISYNF